MLICPFGWHKSNVKLSKSWMKIFYLGANLSCRSSFCEIWCSFRAYSSCSMHAIVACMGLPFFKVFSNFVHFCPKFQIFCPFFPFFTPFFSEKSHAYPYFLEQALSLVKCMTLMLSVILEWYYLIQCSRTIATCILQGPAKSLSKKFWN